MRERLAEDIPVEALADLVELSPFHFSRVFKQATGDVSAAVCEARTDRPRAAADPRNLAQPHRDSARSRIHKPKPFCSSLPARGWGDGHRVPQHLVRRPNFFPQERASLRTIAREASRVMFDDDPVVPELVQALENHMAQAISTTGVQ